MEELINLLQEWKENINYDIKTAEDIQDIGKFCKQSIELSMAIGILNGIGKNNNIPN